MREHVVDDGLCQPIKRFAFREAVTNEFMIAFRGSLVSRAIRSGIKGLDVALPLIIVFQLVKIGEFDAIITKINREDFID